VTVLIASSIGQNPLFNTDVNASGQTSPIDALIIINHLNRGGQTDVNVLAATGVISLENGPFMDVDGNGRIEPLDALLVINVLNRLQGEPESRGEPEDLHDMAVTSLVDELRGPSTIAASYSMAQSIAAILKDGEDEEDKRTIHAEIDWVFEML
jgi:hypothetical protein